MNRNQRRAAAKKTMPLAAQTVPAAFAEAVKLYGANRLAEAARQCETILSNNPFHVGSLQLLGILAQRSGDSSRAIDLLARAANLNPTDPQAHVMVGTALAEAGRLPDARAAFERAVSLEPNNPAYLLRLGNALALLSQTDAAVAVYQKLVALAPEDVDVRLNLGEILIRVGRMAEALQHFEAAAALQPDNARARNNIGFVLNTLKRYGEAIPVLERALAINPNYPEAYNNLGNAHLGLDDFKQATVFYRASLKVRPNYTYAMNNLGNALFRMGRYEEARTEFERARALDPASPSIENGLGNTLQKLGLRAEAMACYEKAIALSPAYVEALTNLATAYNEQGLYERAIASADKAIAADPQSAVAFNARGIALVALERLDEAMASYDKALSLDPGLAQVHVNIGSALVERGRIDEALARFEAAIAINPRDPQFHLCHVLSKKVVAGDPRIAALEALALEAGDLPEEGRVDLNFALAKAYTDTGEREKAVAALLTGNALKRKRVDYNEDWSLGRLDHIVRNWGADVIADWSGHGNPSAQPIFILGMPRSGSTLVEQILASHPTVSAGGEISSLLNATDAALGPIERYVPANEPPENRAALLAGLAERYLAELGTRAHGLPHVTDKMPANFALIGLIRLALPNARIIHTRRNPLDTCVSCFSTLFTAVPYSYDLGELGRYYQAYVRTMDHWSRVLPEGAILDVDYETLVADFDTQARRIVDYCGLPWDEACRTFHTARQPIKTASAIQVRQPLYSSSVGRWRHIDPRLLEPLRAALGELAPADPAS